MCRICESADMVREAAERLTEACLAQASTSTPTGPVGRALASVTPLKPGLPAEYRRLLNRIDRPGRA